MGNVRRTKLNLLFMVVTLSLFCLVLGSRSALASFDTDLYFSSIFDFNVSGTYMAFNSPDYLRGESRAASYDSTEAFNGTVGAQNGSFVAGDIWASSFGEFNVFESGDSTAIDLANSLGDTLHLSFNPLDDTIASGSISGGCSIGSAASGAGAGKIVGEICAAIGSATSGAGAGKATIFANDFSGTISPTPLPAALPLFGCGLGIVGFLARCKKRRAFGALAAT
jgi:hypothetical protein